MKMSVYKGTKLSIFEKAAVGEITESQRDDLFAALEAKKAESELTPEKIEDIFDELVEKYPDLEDDIKGLSDKIAKAGKGDEPEEKADDKGDEEAAPEETTNESAKEIMDMIDAL
jgi:hypothetical protein